MSIIAFNCEYINLQKGNPWLFDEAEFFLHCISLFIFLCEWPYVSVYYRHTGALRSQKSAADTL